MASSFVKKLFEMVENENNDIICWVGQGLAFEVLDPKRLEAEVLPKFFRHSRFQSLVRQLNFYAFRKVSKERSSWVYTHECFAAGRPDLLYHLKRKTNGSASDLTGGMFDSQHRQQFGINFSGGSYDADDNSSLDSPVNSSQKRTFSTTSSSDFQFCPSDEEEQADSCNWAEDERDDLVNGDSDSLMSSQMLVSATSAPNLLLHRSRSGSSSIPGHISGATSIFSCGKKIRRCYSMGEVDNKSYEADRNFEEILSNWNSVHKFFLNKSENVSIAAVNGGENESESEDEEEHDASPLERECDLQQEQCARGAGPCAVRDQDTQGPQEYHQREHGECTAGLLRFCLEKDPWQRSDKLFADIKHLLAADSPLQAEMAAYAAALSPPPHMLRAVVDGRYTQPPQHQYQRQRQEEGGDTDADNDSEEGGDQEGVQDRPQHEDHRGRGQRPESLVISRPCLRATSRPPPVASPHTPRVRMVVQRVPHLSPRCKLTQEMLGNSSTDLSSCKTSSLSSPHSSSANNCEIATVRTFLAFSLACLHSAVAKEQDGDKHNSLVFCADKWGEYAQCCL